MSNYRLNNSTRQSWVNPRIQDYASLAAYAQELLAQGLPEEPAPSIAPASHHPRNATSRLTALTISAILALGIPVHQELETRVEKQPIFDHRYASAPPKEYQFSSQADPNL